MKVLGSTLPQALQREALSRFIHRFTGEHTPRWALVPRPDGSPYPVQFADDADWLAHTHFEVTKKGLLSQRERYCESSPTWPQNPELRVSR